MLRSGKRSSWEVEPEEPQQQEEEEEEEADW